MRDLEGVEGIVNISGEASDCVGDSLHEGFGRESPTPPTLGLLAIGDVTPGAVLELEAGETGE